MTTSPTAADAVNCSVLNLQEGLTIYQCADCKWEFTSLSEIAGHLCTAKAKADSSGEELTTTKTGGSKLDAKANWKAPETKFLITSYKQIEGTMRKSKMWNRISEQLKENGYSYTPQQVEGRWQTLLTRYKAVRDAPSGAARKTFEFEEEMHEVFHGRPNIKPKVTIANITPPPRPNDQKATSSGSGKKGSRKRLVPAPNKKMKSRPEEVSPDSDRENVEQNGDGAEANSDSDGESEDEENVPKKRNTQASMIIEFMRSSRKDVESAQQKRHKEKMEVMKEFVGVLKDLKQ